MTVSEVIAALQSLPNQHSPVKVEVDLPVVPWEAVGPDIEHCDVEDVRNEGPFVVIKYRA